MSNNGAIVKPSRVNHAEMILYLSVVIGIVGAFKDATFPGRPVPEWLAFVAAKTVLVLGPVCFLTYMIGKGKNWARFTLLVFFVLELLGWAALCLYLSEFIIKQYSLSQYVCRFMALILLYSGSASEWFNAIEPQKAETVHQTGDDEDLAPRLGIGYSGSLDEPLFVLKPRESRRTMLAFVVSILFLITGSSLLVMSVDATMSWLTFLILAVMLIGLIVLPLAFLIAELLLFQDIRLYSDRIVKSWKFIGVSEIELDAARMEGGNVLGGMKNICRQGTKRIQRPFMNISYIEDMFEREDIKTFHKLLAELSSRNPAEFERNPIDMKTLIKPVRQ